MIDPLPPGALVLETPRLRLRPFGMEHEALACALLCDPQVMRYVTDPLTADEVRAHMPNAIRRGAGGRIGIWAVEEKATGALVGDCVLTPIPIEGTEPDWDQVVPEAYPTDLIEVGYLLIPSAWGKGYATEAAARLLCFAFEMTDLTTVVGVTDPGNRASQAVLRKCGMRDCGTGRAYGDAVAWFEMTRADWAARA